MESIVIKGQISTMSNKNDSQFKQDVPTKTVYLTVDEDNAAKLQEFGLTMYTSKTDGVDFFALKAAKEIAMYTSRDSGEAPAKLDMTIASGTSIRTADGVSIKMNIISGENMGNTFYRLQAIKLRSSDDITEIKATNPFALDDEDDDF